MFVIVDVRPNVLGLPTAAYEVAEEVQGEGKEIQRVFKHLPSSIDAEEAEGVSACACVRCSNTLSFVTSLFLSLVPSLLRSFAV